MGEMEFYTNCQNYFYSLIKDLEKDTKISKNNLSAITQESFSIFDTNKNDSVLDKSELVEFLKIFSLADKNGDKKLSDTEINNAFNNHNKQFKKVSVEKKKKMLIEVYSKVLAQEIKAQINGPSLNKNTYKQLSKINLDNVVEVLKEYNRISPKETLAYAIDNEWGLGYKTVQKYICEPLRQKARLVGLIKIPDYEKITDIKRLNKYINNLQKRIIAATEPQKVNKNVMGVDVNFTYSRPAIEDHVINHATDKHGKKITYFSRVPAIRDKVKRNLPLTKEESNLINEFNNYITYVCRAGEEYGVDPKTIIAITQQEVGCKGLNKFANGKDNNVTGNNGKGYMQITSICIIELLGGDGDTMSNATYKTDRNKIDTYGKEFRVLLKSKGFNPDCKKEQKKYEAEKIWNHIIANTDPEFDIRFGTLWLRYKLIKSNINVKEAAKKYNGNIQIQQQYADSVYKFYNQLVTNQRKFIN